MPLPRPQNNPRRKVLKRDFAHDLRAQPTDAERKLWARLRSKQMSQLRIRRQQTIGPYVADFYCPAAKLIVELDGGQHAEDRNVSYDAARTLWLESKGLRVIRFTNEDVLKRIDIVLEGIWRAVVESGCPLPEPPAAVRPSLKGRVG